MENFEKKMKNEKPKAVFFIIFIIKVGTMRPPPFGPNTSSSSSTSSISSSSSSSSSSRRQRRSGGGAIALLATVTAVSLGIYHVHWEQRDEKEKLRDGVRRDKIRMEKKLLRVVDDAVSNNAKDEKK